MVHGIDSDGQSRVVPFHFWLFLVDGHSRDFAWSDAVAVALGVADTSNPESNEKNNESDTGNNDSSDTNTCRKNNDRFIKTDEPSLNSQ